jgi:hypothetical protein
MRYLPAAALAAALLAAGPAVADKHHFEFMNKERIGELRIGLPEAAVRRALPGQPQRTREKLQEADGRYVLWWKYPKQGIELLMGSDKKGAAKQIATISCRAPCALRTSRGIGIGSALADVQKAYAAEFNKEDSKDGVFVAGSIYGGLIFDFKAGKVSAMFLGPAAE